MRGWLTSLALAAWIVCGGCSGETETAKPEPQEKPAPSPAPAPPPAPSEPEVLSPPAGHHPALLDPSQATETAPATYKVKFETTKGDFVVQVHRDWAPAGADRFYNLVKMGFYDQAKFFRAVDNFMVQFGISPYPDVSAKWRTASVKDDPPKQSNTRGRITFATSGPNSRTTQVFINYADNSPLDKQGFSPFAEVVEGMEIVDSLYKEYGEGAPRGRGPDQGRIQSKGNAYLEDKFPKLDGIKKASILE
jgi:peptidyl-prolyl cis-trans isomerase A (cyclophilin A)